MCIEWLKKEINAFKVFLSVHLEQIYKTRNKTFAKNIFVSLLNNFILIDRKGITKVQSLHIGKKKTVPLVNKYIYICTYIHILVEILNLFYEIKCVLRDRKKKEQRLLMFEHFFKCNFPINHCRSVSLSVEKVEHNSN